MRMRVTQGVLLLSALVGLTEMQVLLDQRWSLLQPVSAGTIFSPDSVMAIPRPVQQPSPQRGSGTFQGNLLRHKSTQQSTGTQRTPVIHQVGPQQPIGTQGTPVIHQGTPVIHQVGPQRPTGTQRTPVIQQVKPQQPTGTQRTPVIQQVRPQQPTGTQRTPVIQQVKPQQPTGTQRTPVIQQVRPQQPIGTQGIPVTQQRPKQHAGAPQGIPVTQQRPKQHDGAPQGIPVTQDIPRQQTGTQEPPVGRGSPHKVSGFSASSPASEGRHPSCGMIPSPGECRAAFPRYYFNPKTNQCDCFLYGGCGKEGLVSSYQTLRECQETCLPLNMDEGPQCKEVFRNEQTFFSLASQKQQQQASRSEAPQKSSTVGGRPFPDTTHINDRDLLHRLEESQSKND